MKRFSIAAASVGLLVGSCLFFTGCTGNATGDGKMGMSDGNMNRSNEPMSAMDKMDTMGPDRMSTDKMSSDKMSSDKMSSDKMSSDKMSSDKMSDPKMATK